MPCGVGKVDGLIEKPARPGFEEGEEESRADAGQGEPIGQPEVLRVESGERGQEPAERGVAENLNEAVGDGMRDLDAVGGGKQGIAEANPAGGPEQAYGKLDERIAEADPGMAGAAAAAEQNPA